MAGLNWDRLRRIRPLDGADRRVDPDGAHLWEQAKEEYVPFGARRLRRGVIVRRRAPDAPPPARPTEKPKTIRCGRCGARVAARKIVRHRRRCPSAP